MIRIGALWPKSILNRSGANQFTLNPYRGCAVGCAYCYVPYMPHMKAEPRKWGTYVDVKLGAARALERELSRLERPAELFMSTATDPYQPAEHLYQITRALLEVLARHPQHALRILTKQLLVERDADILSRLPRAAVGMSISTMDDELSSVIEPWAPVTSERMAALERLSRLGIKTYIIWAPVLVPSPMREDFVAGSVERLAASGIRWLLLDSLNYRSSQSPGFYRRLARAGHAPATAAQIKLIRDEADRRGLGRRISFDPIPHQFIQPGLF